MDGLNIGDIVARKSYNYDVLFRVKKISGDMVDLIGISVRIIADAPIYDLKKIAEEEVHRINRETEINNRSRLSRSYNGLNSRFHIRDRSYTQVSAQTPIYTKENVYKKPGIVLHIDGDLEYATKCKDVYKRMGVTAYVYNISESEQPKYIYSLLSKLRPNILIVTGHDAFIRKKNDMYNINNYKNSRYYIESVLEARRYEHSLDNLVIFAGACQSYYEAIISAGANFASAPKRVLIDMLDPIIVAQTVAYTPVDKFVPLAGILSNTREGLRGIGGVQTRGQYREGMPGI